MVNVDVTAPGATIALALIFLKVKFVIEFFSVNFLFKKLFLR